MLCQPKVNPNQKQTTTKESILTMVSHFPVDTNVSVLGEKGWIQTLPYPLGYRWKEFTHEFQALEQGNESSNFPFFLVSLNGLMMRLSTALLVGEFCRVCIQKEEVLDYIGEKLKSSSDGMWRQVIVKLLEFFESQPISLSIRELCRALQKVYPIPGNKKGIHALQVMQQMIELRNQLLHSTKRLERTEIQLCLEKIKVLFGSLSPVFRGYVLGYVGGHYYLYRGSFPEKLVVLLHQGYQRLLSQDQPESIFFDISEDFASVFDKDGSIAWWSGKRDEQPISLWPLVCGNTTHDAHSEQERHDLLFLNGWEQHRVAYISYWDTAPHDDQQLGISLVAFQRFWNRNWREHRVPRRKPRDIVDYSLFSKRYRDCFVGRESEIQTILRFATTSNRFYGILQGAPGCGKTAILANMYCRWRDPWKSDEEFWPIHVLPLWYFASPFDRGNRRLSFLNTVISQMDEYLEPDIPSLRQQRVSDYSDEWVSVEQEFLDKLQSFQRRWDYLCRVSQEQGKHVILFLDGWDDVDCLLQDASVLTCLRQISRTSSNHILFSCSGVGLQIIKQQMGLGVDDLYSVTRDSSWSGLAKREVSRWLRDLYPGKISRRVWHTLSVLWMESNTQNRVSTGLADHALERVVPQYLNIVADGLFQNLVSLDRIESIPSDLEQWCERILLEIPTFHHGLIHRLLGILAIVPGFGCDEWFAQLFSFEKNNGVAWFASEIAEMRRNVNQHLVFCGERYQIFHQPWRAFLLKRFRSDELVRSLLEPWLNYILCVEQDWKQPVYQQVLCCLLEMNTILSWYSKEPDWIHISHFFHHHTMWREYRKGMRTEQRDEVFAILSRKGVEKMASIFFENLDGPR